MIITLQTLLLRDPKNNVYSNCIKDYKNSQLAYVPFEQLLGQVPNNNGSIIQLNKRNVFWFIVIFITFTKAYAKFLQIIIIYKLQRKKKRLLKALYVCNKHIAK